MNFSHSRCLSAQGACNFLWCLDIVGDPGQKQNWFGKKLLKKCTIFFFFLLEQLECHSIAKSCNHLAYPSLFVSKKLNILLTFFFNLTIHRCTNLLFFLSTEVLECRNTTKFCTRLAHTSIFVPRNFRIFEFFCYLFLNLLFIDALFMLARNRSRH